MKRRPEAEEQEVVRSWTEEAGMVPVSEEEHSSCSSAP